MKNVINSRACRAAGLEVANIPFDEAQARALRPRHRGANLVEVTPVPGGKVVEPHHFLLQPEQRFDEVAADEARGPGNEPAPRRFAQARNQLSVSQLLEPPERSTGGADRGRVVGGLHIDEKPGRPDLA